MGSCIFPISMEHASPANRSGLTSFPCIAYSACSSPTVKLLEEPRPARAGKSAIETAEDAALALRPLAHEGAYLLFAAGLFNASLFAASILPISTAYAVCEGLGFESGLDKRFEEAPAFYWLYTALIVFGAGVVLIPGFPLFRVMVLSQVVNGVLLPFVLVFVLMLINDRELMGDYTNSRPYNVISWVTVTVMALLTIAMMVAQGRS